jgi:hypothetical protein
LAAGAGYLFANMIRLAIITKFSKSDFHPSLSVSAVLIYSLPPLIGGLAMAGLLSIAQPQWSINWLSLMLLYIFTAATIAVAALMSTALFRQGRQQLQESFIWASKTLLNKR